MSHSFSRVIVHLVFSTKNRQPFILPQFRDQTFSYLAGTLNNIGCPAIIVGGMPDHIHLLFAQSRSKTMSDIVKDLKVESSQWAKSIISPAFYWQSGYGAFSVSTSNVEKVRKYIAEQEQHHQELTFQDEYRELLRKHGIEWNEKYIWS